MEAKDKAGYEQCKRDIAAKRRQFNTGNVYIQAGITEGMKIMAEFINNLIIGVQGCEWEERLDGDKGCIMLDMNENQWQKQLKDWGIE